MRFQVHSRLLSTGGLVGVAIACGVGILLGPLATARTNGQVILGFSQIGAESAWRVASTKSIKEAARESGVSLTFADAQQKQVNQIKAIKSFILQKVDVIGFSPVVESGWHDVLVMAKEAHIPVVILDRQIDEADSSLYTTYIGSDFLEEGRRAGKCLLSALSRNPRKRRPLNIVELRGTEGSAPAIDRKRGFAQILKNHPELQITRSEGGDFKESLGREQMSKILVTEKKRDRPIDVLFAHNDDMALGAIAAIEAQGLRPGSDILIISVDGTQGAFQAMKEGKIACTIECSPLLGRQLMEAVKKLANGETVPRRIVTEESVFPSWSIDPHMNDRKY